MSSNTDRFNCGQSVKKSGLYAKHFRNGQQSKDTPCDLHPGDRFPPTGRKGMHWRRIGKPSKATRHKRPVRLCEVCGSKLPEKPESAA